MKFLRELINCAPIIHVQLLELALLTAIFFPLMHYIKKSIVVPFMRRLPIVMQEDFGRRSQQSVKTTLFTDINKNEAFHVGCQIISVLFLHILGGCLCIPSVFKLGWISPETAVTLACHGALVEAGWELQDTILRGYQICVAKPKRAVPTEPQKSVLGKAKLLATEFAHRIVIVGRQGHLLSPEIDDDPVVNPVAILITIAMHHVAGQLLIIPMNLYYRSNAIYHEMIFLLLFAGTICLGLQMYSYTIDTTSFKGKCTMVASVFVSWLVMLWSRVYRFGYLTYAGLAMMHADGSVFMFRAGLCGAVFMTIFNALMVIDCSKKLIKFTHQLYHWKANGHKKLE